MSMYFTFPYVQLEFGENTYFTSVNDKKTECGHYQIRLFQMEMYTTSCGVSVFDICFPSEF